MENQNKRPLYSIVSYPDRGEGGNNRYRGNCSPKLIEDLIDYFGIQDICDYMCGSNTTGDTARKKESKAIPMICTAALISCIMTLQNGLK